MLKLITHPITGETMNQREWSERLGISDAALSERMKKYSLEKALTPGKLREKYNQWSPEEDEYLLTVYRTPGLYRLWCLTAKQRGWKHRTRQALNQRGSLLQRQGRMTNRRHLDELTGWLTMTQLAERLMVSPMVVSRWIYEKDLPAYRDGQKIVKIHLYEFAAWAITPNGAGQVAKSLKSNPLATSWLLTTVGHWLFESPPILGKGVSQVVKSRNTDINRVA